MSNRKGIGSHQSASSLKDEWLTPPSLLAQLGSFDLDPCAAVNQPWPTAASHFTIKDDGLSKAWFGRVWLNPPYGTQTWTWLKRLADYGHGIALTFARTETKMFFDAVWDKADALLFLRGRLHFYHGNGTKAKANAGGPSVLIAYGQRDAGVLRSISQLGKFIDLRG